MAKPTSRSRKAGLEELIAEQQRDNAQTRIRRRESALLDTDRQTDEAPAPPRRNRGDAPAAFDEELGRIVDWEGGPGEPERELTDGEFEQYVDLATTIVARLGPFSRYRVLWPLARPPEIEKRFKIDRHALRALPELIALHHRLFDAWPRLVLHWLDRRAKAAIEARHRAVRESDARRGRRVNVLPERTVLSAEDLFARLHQNPSHLMGPLPRGLSVKLLTIVGELVEQPPGSRYGGAAPQTALEMLTRWCSTSDPEEAARNELRKRTEQRAKRRRRRH